MADTSNTNQPRIGMNTDSFSYNLQKGEYSFALNATYENEQGNGGVLQNIESNYLTAEFPNYKIIGNKYIPELRRSIFMLVNTSGNSIIAELLDKEFSQREDINYVENPPLESTIQLPYNNFRVIVQTNNLNFNINNPVKFEYRISRNGINLYFIDDLNPLRFIYFNLVDDKLILQDRFKVVTGYDPDNCDLPIYSKELDANKIRYNPDFSRPCVEFVDDVFGGSLKAGSYQALVCYADSLGNPLTKYFPATSIIPIKTKGITIEPDYKTDKALVFKINNLEQSSVFTHYNIVIAETMKDFTEFKLAATLPISQESYTYTGNANDYKTLTPQDVFFERPIYSKAFAIGQANDYLFYGNLEEYPKLNLQPIANKIKLFWATKAIDEELLKDARYANKLRGYMRDEVYALGIVFELKDDNDTIGFHLPGPSKEYFRDNFNINVDQLVDNEDTIPDESCADIQNNKYWQMYNIAKVAATPHEYSTKCDDDKVWEWGTFSYHESIRNYPNIPEIWGDLCGKPIRHHKFPDSNVTHFHDGLGTNKNFTEGNIVYPIGIKVDHSSVVAAISWAVANNIISEQDAARIKGYRIVRGNRVGNKSIIAKGLLYDVWSYNRDNKEIYYPNFPYNDLSSNYFIAPDDRVYSQSNTSNPTPSEFRPSKRYTFHSPDIHFTNPSPSNILKLESLEYGQSSGFFNNAEEQAEYQILSQTARTLCFVAGVVSVFGEIFKLESTIEQELKPSTFVVPIDVMAFGTGTTIPVPVPDPLFLLQNFLGVSLNPFKTGIYNRMTGLNQALPGAEATKRITQDIKGSPFQLMNPLGGLASGLPTLLKPIVTGIVLAAGAFNQGLYLLTRIVQEADNFSQTIKKLIPKMNYAIQYNSVGKYNNYIPISTFGKIYRPIQKWEYLPSSMKSISEGNKSILFNNWNRESSLYLKLADNKSDFDAPAVRDTSRITMAQAVLKYGDLNRDVTRNISSYYGSLKNNIPDQYGSIYNVEYLETSGCAIPINVEDNAEVLFGGDTFISRFALKRKHPLFIQNRFRQLDNADVLYSKLGNAGYPNYFIDFNQSFGERLQEALDTEGFFNILRELIESMMGLDESRLDVKVGNLFYQKGYIHLYNYGIPYFLVESDVNCFYRHSENDKERDHYPHNNNLSHWLQEKNVPISEDNTYIYNKDYSKQNKESIIKTITPQSRFNDLNAIKLDRRIINTERAKTLNENDNWLILKANNYTNVDARNGSVFGVDGIEDENILIRAANSSYLINAYSKLQTNGTEIQVGRGGLYEGIKEFVSTDLGFMGSQNRSMLRTEFGHIWADAKRGQIFLLGSKGAGLEEISGNKMRNWFRENLPFQLAKDFNIDPKDLDNNYKGIGLHFSYDKRFARIFLTKLDYKVIDKDVKYNPVTKTFYKVIEGLIVNVSLSNPTYFCNKSWTISYNLLLKSWISFYSFIPNFYNDLLNTFQSGLNNGQIWTHNLSNKSYQVFYGVKHPFIIEVPSEFKGNNNFLENIEYVNDCIRYHGESDWFYNRRVTFNKAIVYNERQNSGELELIPKDNENLSLVGSLPKVVGNKYQINISNVENNWKFNEFFDSVKSQLNNTPIWKYDCNNVNKNLNQHAFNYSINDYDKALIRGKNCSIRLINDKFTNYKFMFIFSGFNQNNSIQ